MADTDVKFRLTATDQTQQAFDQARRSLESLNHTAEKLKSIGEFAIGGFTVDKIVEFGRSIIDLGDEMNDMSTRTGVSVKTLASYKLAAEQSGTSLEAVAKGINKMTLSIGQAGKGNAEVAASLQSLGVTSKDAQKGFEQLADAVANSNDPTKLAADLQKVLGKNYAELLPILKEGSGYLRESAEASESFADQMAKLAPNADHFNDQLAQIKLNVAGVSVGLLNDLVPSLNDTAKAMIKLQQEGHGVEALLRGVAGIGKLPFDLLFPDHPDTKESKLKDLRQELSDLQRHIPETQGGGALQRWLYGTTDELKQKILVTQNQIAAIEKFGDKIYGRQQASGKDAKGGKPDSNDISDQLACVASGGIWDGKKCIKKASGSGRGGIDKDAMHAADMAEAWKQADAELKKYNDDLQFMNEVDIAQNNPVADLVQQWKDAGAALHESLKTPLETLDERLSYIDELMRRNVISVEDYGRAYAAALDEGNAKAEKTKSLAEEIGLTFTSAFEDAIAGGKSFKDVLKSLEQDIAKLLVRKAVTEPLMNAIGSIFPHADGGIAAWGRPVPLPRFAGGGVSNSIAIFGEAGPEAAVPLPDGRRIPVDLRGGGGGVSVVVNNNAPGTQATATSRDQGGVQMIDIVVEQVEAKMGRNLASGRGLAPTMERRYGLNPAAGSQR